MEREVKIAKMEAEKKHQNQQLKALEIHLEQALDETVKVKSELRVERQQKKEKEEEEIREEVESVKQEEFKEFKKYITNELEIIKLQLKTSDST